MENVEKKFFIIKIDKSEKIFLLNLYFLVLLFYGT